MFLYERSRVSGAGRTDDTFLSYESSSSMFFIVTFYRGRLGALQRLESSIEVMLINSFNKVSMRVFSLPSKSMQ